MMKSKTAKTDQFIPWGLVIRNQVEKQAKATEVSVQLIWLVN